MRSKLIPLLSLLSLLLSGCGSKKPSGNLDANRAFSSNIANACATEDTVYFAVAHNGEPYSYFMLHYMDKATGISGPLCGKVECDHNSSDCNAYIALDLTALSVYDGKLYWLETTFGTAGYGKTVVSMALDGTDRREICEVSNELLSSGTSALRYFKPYFHRGYIYLTYKSQYIGDGREVTRNHIGAFALDSGAGEEVEILDEDASNIFNVQFYGDSMYILTGSDFDEITIRRWDIKTGEMEGIFDGNLSFNCSSEFWVTDDGIYFDGCVQTGTDESGNNVWQDNVYRYDFASGEFEQAYTLMSRVTCNIGVSENVFIDMTEAEGGMRILIKDFDGSTVLDTVVSDEILPRDAALTIAGADDTNLYLYTQVDPESFIVIPLDGSDARVLWSDQL